MRIEFPKKWFEANVKFIEIRKSQHTDKCIHNTNNGSTNACDSIFKLQNSLPAMDTLNSRTRKWAQFCLINNYVYASGIFRWFDQFSSVLIIRSVQLPIILLSLSMNVLNNCFSPFGCPLSGGYSVLEKLQNPPFLLHFSRLYFD